MQAQRLVSILEILAIVTNQRLAHGKAIRPDARRRPISEIKEGLARFPREAEKKESLSRDLIAIETHKKQGSVTTLDRLARALSVPIEALIAERVED